MTLGTATMQRHRSTCPAQRHQGFSLLEVLVAILVLAIGLLGLAALQARGVKFNHDAYARSQATYLAYEVMDLMRANRAVAAQYVTTTPATSPCNPAVSSVANDLKCWNDALQATLASGGATLVQTAGTATATDPDDDQFDVTIRWQERGAREATGQSDCEAVPSRLWADPVCLVTQSWTFRP